MWMLTITDLTHVGGPMGSEYTSDHTFAHKTIEGAKLAAETHYNGSRGPIEWTKKGRRYSSQDLGYVMYSIEPLKIGG